MPWKLPRFTLNTALLCLTLFSISVVQVSIEMEEKRELRAWTDSPFDSRVGRFDHPFRRTGVLGTVNFVIVVAAMFFYRRYKRRAIWVAVFADLLATGIVVLVWEMLR